MKSLFPVLLLSSIFAAGVSAQKSPNENKQAKDPFSVDAVTPAASPVGNNNYLLSLSAADYKAQKYVFCTDSNASVAHITINGTDVRMTGGPNPEGIMTYHGKEYTVTLSTRKKSGGAVYADDDRSGKSMDAVLAIYSSDGKVVGKKVTGIQTTAVKK